MLLYTAIVQKERGILYKEVKPWDLKISRGWAHLQWKVSSNEQANGFFLCFQRFSCSMLPLFPKVHLLQHPLHCPKKLFRIKLHWTFYVRIQLLTKIVRLGVGQKIKLNPNWLEARRELSIFWTCPPIFLPSPRCIISFC